MFRAFGSQAHWPPPPLVTPENTASQLVGSKVLIRTNDEETYQGIVRRVWGDSEKISLDKVVAVPSQKAFIGLLYFFKKDILSITVVLPCPTMKESKSKMEKNAVQLKPLPFGQLETAEASECSDEDEDNFRPVEPVFDDVADYAKTGDISWEIDENDDRETWKPSDLRSPLPTKYITLDEINSEFVDSISDLNGHAALGVSLESTKGRLGEIVILSVATETVVYLYDIMTLGKKGFDHGLKNVLESDSILKVMHDCRMPSDALFHLFKVKLNHIFDTQVGDVVCHLKDNKHSLPQHVMSLNQCLRKYLNVSQRFLPADSGSLRGPQKDLPRWKTRPIMPSCREQSIRNVSFLQELRQSVLDKILSDFNLGVSIYLSAVRDASQEELALNLGSPDVLPPAMSRITSKDIDFIHRNQSPLSMQSSHNIWNRNSNPGLQHGGNSGHRENLGKHKSHGASKQIPNGTSSDQKLIGNRYHIDHRGRRSLDDQKLLRESNHQEHRTVGDHKQRGAGDQGRRSLEDHKRNRENDHVDHQEPRSVGDHKQTVGGDRGLRSLDDPKQNRDSNHVGHRGHRSVDHKHNGGDHQQLASGSVDNSIQPSHKSHQENGAMELGVSELFKNIKWASDSRSLPMDKCSPAGEMQPVQVSGRKT